MTEGSLRHPYTPSHRGSLPWRAFSVIWWVMLRPSVVARDTRHRSRGQLMNAAIETSIGAQPEPELRQDALKLLMYAAIIAGFITGALGLMIGALLQPLMGLSAGAAVMRAFGVVLAAPCLALGMIWAGRAQLNEQDLRRWRAEGSRQPYEPAMRTQPKNRDALYALPLWILLAAFFITA